GDGGTRDLRLLHGRRRGPRFRPGSATCGRQLVHGGGRLYPVIVAGAAVRAGAADPRLRPGGRRWPGRAPRRAVVAEPPPGRRLVVWRLVPVPRDRKLPRFPRTPGRVRHLAGPGAAQSTDE